MSDHSERLQQLERASFRRMEARQQAVQEWIARRRTLAETMQRFQELDQEWPDYSTLVRKTQSESDEERYYRVIGTYVKGILQRQPEELAAVLQRLEKDYQQLQASRQASSTAATVPTEPNR